MQMTCRDRNRIAMQSDILGASALGIRNVLCISGDHQIFGNQKEAKNVYDLDSIQQLMVFRSDARRGQGLGRGQARRPPRSCSSERRRTRSPTRSSSGSPVWPRRSTPGPTSSRPSPSTTWTASRRSMDQVRERGLRRKVAHLGRGDAAEIAQGRSVHEEQGLRHDRPGRDGRPLEDRGRPEGGRHQLCVETDRAPEAHRRASMAFTSWPWPGRRRCRR